MTAQVFSRPQIVILEAIKNRGYHQIEDGENLYVTTAGHHTPFYYDMRMVMSDTNILRLIVYELNKIVPSNIASVGGMAVGAIPLITAFAMYRGIPYYYIRPERKDHGLQNQIEGQVVMPTHILDDVYNTGSSFQKCREVLCNYFMNGKIPAEVSHEGVFMFMGHVMSTPGTVIIDRDHNFYGETKRDYSIKAVDALFTHSQFQDYLSGHYELTSPE